MIRLLRYCSAYCVQAFLAFPVRRTSCAPPISISARRPPTSSPLLWKVPALGDMRLGLYVRLPDTCKTKAEPTWLDRSRSPFRALERRYCAGGLKGHEPSR